MKQFYVGGNYPERLFDEETLSPAKNIPFEWVFFLEHGVNLTLENPGYDFKAIVKAESLELAQAEIRKYFPGTLTFWHGAEATVDSLEIFKSLEGTRNRQAFGM